MSLDLKEDILKAVKEAERREEKKARKRPKKYQYFIIKFPNGVEALIRCKGWAGVNDYVKYFKDEYDENTLLVSISKREARKFVRKGTLFR